MIRDDAMRFIHQLTRYKLGLALLVIHSAFVIYAVASKPTTESRQELIDCRTTALAGRAIQLSREPALLKTLGWLDLPALIVYYVLWRLLYVVIDIFQISVNLYWLSWINAIALLLLTAMQWWAIGFCAQWVIERAKKSEAYTQIKNDT